MSILTNAQIIALELRNTVARAEAMGVSIRIDRRPLQPLAMGHAEHVVETWEARNKPNPPERNT